MYASRVRELLVNHNRRETENAVIFAIIPPVGPICNVQKPTRSVVGLEQFLL